MNLYLYNKLLASLPDEASFDELAAFIDSEIDDYYLIQNGRLVSSNSVLSNLPVHIFPRLRGGKGGFGSMLRAIGAQIEKTTNREACRDLSGRRLRDINEEKRLKKWIADQGDREREAAEKKKKKLEKLKHVPKHNFEDADYDKVRSEMTEKVHSALEEGLKAATSAAASVADDEQPGTSQGTKRKLETKEKKKGLLWIDGDELGSDLSDSDEDDDEAETSKKLKAES